MTSLQPIATRPHRPSEAPGQLADGSTDGGGEAKQAQTLSVHLQGRLQACRFEATLTQRFHNPTATSVEMVYRFPLPWRAVLLGVAVDLGARTLRGQVIEQSQAQAQYESAIHAGQTAILLERLRDHSHVLNLGHLAPGETCTVSLRYAQVLQPVQGAWHLLVPTVLAPRYGVSPTAAVWPHHRLQHDLNAQYPFTVAIACEGAWADARIESPSHALTQTLECPTDAPDRVGTRWLRLATPAALDRDLVLLLDPVKPQTLAVQCPDPAQPGTWSLLAGLCPVGRQASSDAASAPQTSWTAPAPLALKLLVDCSGSMAGDSLQSAQRALLTILTQLSEADACACSRFGSTVQHLSPAVEPFGPEWRRQAEQWVQSLTADLGGTEMAAALHASLALRGRGGRRASVDSGTAVLLVTDGEVEAIDDVIAAAQAGEQRVFVVGIGSSPAEAHLRRLAEATGGACDFVAPGEAVEPAVRRMFARLRSPRYTELQLAWPNGVKPLWVAPLPAAVYDGDMLTLFARLPEPAQGPLRLLGRLPGVDGLQTVAEVELSLPSNGQGAATDLTQDDALPRLRAMAEFEALYAASQVAEDGASPEALAVALNYQLVTPLTHFVLVDEPTEPVAHPASDSASEGPALLPVAQMLPAGWAGWGTVRRRGPVAVRGADIKFCRKNDTDEPARPRSIHYKAGVATHPLTLVEWLRRSPVSTWPTNFEGLRSLRLPSDILSWLETWIHPSEDKVAVTPLGGTPLTEAEVVRAFLSWMARRETLVALLQTEDASLRSRLRLLVARWQPAGEWPGPSVTVPDLETCLAQRLEGMTANNWPNFESGNIPDAMNEDSPPEHMFRF